MTRSITVVTAFWTVGSETMNHVVASMRLPMTIGGLLCLSLAVADESELERYRTLWSASGLENYVYAYQKYCECHRDEPPQTFVTVRSGTIDRVHHLHANSDREVPAREGSLDLYWTIDDLFSLIAAAEERGVNYRAAYDSMLGHPTLVYIDYDPAALGEEIDIRLTAFEPGD